MEFLLQMFIAVSLFSSVVKGQSCAGYTFSGNAIFPSCTDLPYLNSFLHWNYDPTTNSVNIAYRHSGASPNRWTAWALNPTGTGMAGAQALIAFQQSDGSMAVYTTPISDNAPSLQPGSLSFQVTNLTASFTGNDIIIFANLGLGNLNGSVNQLWQEGPVSGGSPLPHPQSGPNLLSLGTVDFQAGTTASGGGSAAALSLQQERNIHGVLNVLGWGTLIPFGAIIARYIRMFDSADPAWYYLHVSCQISGYMIGVSGWATGLHLGSESPGITHVTHRAVGIAIFCLATIQVSALLLRPKKDHKHRFCWNIYHHTVGYLLILLSVINIFKGFDILNPERQWKTIYVVIIALFLLVSAILEAYTCLTGLRWKKSKGEEFETGYRV